MAIDKAAVLLAVIAVGSFLFVLAMIKYLIAHYDTRLLLLPPSFFTGQGTVFDNKVMQIMIINRFHDAPSGKFMLHRYNCRKISRSSVPLSVGHVTALRARARVAGNDDDGTTRNTNHNLPTHVMRSSRMLCYVAATTCFFLQGGVKL